jgi:uncharacterized membrane protein YeaQ/YmgE (transglycosylase-associated protein family)
LSLIAYLIILFFTGLLVGALSRLVLPGRDPMTIPQTALVGIAGSAIAGLISLAIFHGRSGAGLILSVACGTFFVWLARRTRTRSASKRRGGFVGRR